MPLFFILPHVQQIQQYGLIGYPLTHSFSPGYFNAKFRHEGIAAHYRAYPLQTIDELPALLQQHHIRALNVTTPYKQQVIPFLHEIDKAAQHIGAVNCIDIRNGRLKGYNTDASGFRQSLEPLLQPHHKAALILGTGGASLAVKYVLAQMGIAYQSISRTKQTGTLTYEELTEDMIASHTLIINTTPLGMHPHTGEYPPLPYTAISSAHLLYDLVYNPAQTPLLEKGKEKGAAIKNGLEMLHLQAEASWHIWNS